MGLLNTLQGEPDCAQEALADEPLLPLQRGQARQRQGRVREAGGAAGPLRARRLQDQGRVQVWPKMRAIGCAIRRIGRELSSRNLGPTFLTIPVQQLLRLSRRLQQRQRHALFRARRGHLRLHGRLRHRGRHEPAARPDQVQEGPPPPIQRSQLHLERLHEDWHPRPTFGGQKQVHFNHSKVEIFYLHGGPSGRDPGLY